MDWQEEGLQAFLNYLKDLISKRAEEDYTSLVEGGGTPYSLLGRFSTYDLPHIARHGTALA